MKKKMLIGVTSVVVCLLAGVTPNGAVYAAQAACPAGYSCAPRENCTLTSMTCEYGVSGEVWKTCTYMCF